MSQQQNGHPAQTAGRTSWGRSRFGGGGGLLLLGSLAIGLPIALGLIWLEIRFGNPPQPWVFFWILLAAQLPITTAAGWALLVDRSTLRGAVTNTEDTIENQWYVKATSGAFLDVFVVLGLGSGLTAYVTIPLSVSWVLTIVALFALLDFGLRYLFLKRADG